MQHLKQYISKLVLPTCSGFCKNRTHICKVYSPFMIFTTCHSYQRYITDLSHGPKCWSIQETKSDTWDGTVGELWCEGWGKRTLEFVNRQHLYVKMMFNINIYDHVSSGGVFSMHVPVAQSSRWTSRWASPIDEHILTETLLLFSWTFSAIDDSKANAK